MRTVSNCILCLTDYALNGALNSNVGESPRGINLYNEIMKKPEESTVVIEEFLELLKEYERIEHIFDIRATQEKFSSSLIKEFSKDKILTRAIVPTKLLERESDFYNSLSDEEYLNVLKKFVTETDLVKTIIEGNFKVSLASLYSVIIDTKTKSDEFVNYLNTSLGRMTKETWLSEFDKKHVNSFDLLITLIEHNYKPGLKSEFKSVLENFINKIQKKDFDPKNKTEMVKILQCA